MSQQLVGQVYSRIIDEVCDASQVDFEEGGVDSETLRLLKQCWQKKLSALEVGHFPWEPQPQTPSASVASATSPTPQSTPGASSNPPKSQQQHVSDTRRPSPAPPSTQASRLKGVAGQYQSTASPPMGYPMSQAPPLPQQTTSAVAQQRAAQALQQQYGPRAAAQINQLQQSSNQRQQPGLPNPSFQEADDRKSTLPTYPPSVPQSPAPLRSAQQDGGNDSLVEWKAEVARRRAAGHIAGGSDRLFHEHMLQTQQRIEGGGLLLPLSEHHMIAPGIKRRVVEALCETGEVYPQCSSPSPTAGPLSRAQGDAPGDDDDDKDLDEDAINSDLDDPEDAGGHPEDEMVEQVMLCTYDKVQRVKNKWKCTLKDGILRVANKEYVFHKGQGEFEW